MLYINNFRYFLLYSSKSIKLLYTILILHITVTCFFSAYKNTNPSHLLEALSKFHDDKTINFTDVMKNWIYESGYPIVTASLNKNKNVVKIHQVCTKNS